MLWCLTPLSTIFQLYRASQFYWFNNTKTGKKILLALNLRKKTNVLFFDRANV